MALSDFQVFNDFAYNSFVTTYQQNAELFNGASNNAIQLRVMGFSGDYKSKSQFENLASLVGNRDASSTEALQPSMHLLSCYRLKLRLVWVLLISATQTLHSITPNAIQPKPVLLFGEAIAEGAMAYQLNSALSALVASVAAADVTYDGTAAIASLESLNAGAGKFGDRRQAITAWVMHSKSITDIYAGALANSNRLFEFGTIQVMDDGFGRPLIMTDSDALHFDNAGTENYHQLGLVAGAIAVEDQGDLRVYNVTDLSEDNAKQLMKVEATFGVGLKGYTWNTAVVKPDDAALALAGNWARVTNLGLKDTAGVKVTTL